MGFLETNTVKRTKVWECIGMGIIFQILKICIFQGHITLQGQIEIGQSRSLNNKSEI